MVFHQLDFLQKLRDILASIFLLDSVQETASVSRNEYLTISEICFLFFIRFYSIGMKFALLEIKLALTRILLNFDILASPNTPDKLILEEGFSVRRPKGGVNVIFKRRNR